MGELFAQPNLILHKLKSFKGVNFNDYSYDPITIQIIISINLD